MKGYTLNGIYFGKYKGIIFNFEISKTGKIIINELIEGQLKIRVLHPVNFDALQTKDLQELKEKLFIFISKNQILFIMELKIMNLQKSKLNF